MKDRRAVFALAACLLVVAACGNRLSEDEILAKNTLVQDSVSGDASQAFTPAGSGASSAVGAIGAGTTDGGGDGGTGTDGAQVGAGTSTGGGPAVTGPANGTATSTTLPQSSGPKSTIRVGFIGSLSGAPGVTVGPVRDAWKVWEKAVNARGGIGGHPVEVLIGDDGTNDARGLTIGRDFIENKGVVALSWASNDITSLSNYAQSKRVPIMGVVEGQPVWGTNSMMFPITSGADSGWGTARVMSKAGASKIALLYCVEAATCESGANNIEPYAGPEGLEIVYRSGISLTQPDYTAECLQARNRGADGVILLVDQNAVLRFMQSCSRQGYRPATFGTGNDSQAELAELDGLVTGGGTFPWFMRSGSPGLEEYTQALETFAPDMLTDGSSFQSLGWTAAKMFERAIENVLAMDPDIDEITNEDVLRGLWAMNGEELDGLATGRAARRFVAEQPNNHPQCTFVSQLKDGKWTSLTGLVPECL